MAKTSKKARKMMMEEKEMMEDEDMGYKKMAKKLRKKMK